MASAPAIGLLGGGQLGRMFIENALRYDVKVHVLDPDPQAPCSRIAHRFVVGDLNDTETVLDFAKELDIIGIEIEHVSVEALVALKAQGKTVIPDPEVLRTIQDKGLQKEFYARHNIPSAPYKLLASGKTIPKELSALLPAFLKLRTGGYDGKGVISVDSHDTDTTAFSAPCVLEKRVDIACELAVLVARSAEGEQVVYDPVEMVFDPRFNLVDHLRAPARSAPEILKKAQELAGRVANAFSTPGLYAVELFLSRYGELLVNETAPRAHNSGHHSIEACNSSQFDQLLRTYLGWPLGDPTLHASAAMVNLVGEGGEGTPEVLGMKELLARPGTFPHLYGKAKTRTGRKMGHVTLTAPDDPTLDEGIAAVREYCKVVPQQNG